MKKKELQQLIERYERGESTEKDHAFLDQWYNNLEVDAFDLSEKELREDLLIIKSKLAAPDKSTRLWIRVCVAATLVMAMSVFYYIVNNTDSSISAPTVQNKEKIIPGRNQATLILSDGSTVLLDTATQLATINQHGVEVTKTADGKLVYTNVATGAQVDAYNTIETPKGGRYDVTLPDGTLVSLNAASKIRFPIIFSNAQRRIELEGEAYFEVKKDAAKPFLVVSGKQTVRVLGTHFNINSYENEPLIRTTLLEGSVMVQGSTEILLKPGEQAQASHAADNYRVAKVDVQSEIAWKDNLFFFENEPIRNCMREVARWYDVDVVYDSDVQDKKVWGSITRFSGITKVLDILEQTGNIHFKVEGRRITVTK